MAAVSEPPAPTPTTCGTQCEPCGQCYEHCAADHPRPTGRRLAESNGTAPPDGEPDAAAGASIAGNGTAPPADASAAGAVADATMDPLSCAHACASTECQPCKTCHRDPLQPEREPHLCEIACEGICRTCGSCYDQCVDDNDTFECRDTCANTVCTSCSSCDSGCNPPDMAAPSDCESACEPVCTDCGSCFELCSGRPDHERGPCDRHCSENQCSECNRCNDGCHEPEEPPTDPCKQGCAPSCEPCRQCYQECHLQGAGAEDGPAFAQCQRSCDSEDCYDCNTCHAGCDPPDPAHIHGGPSDMPCEHACTPMCEQCEDCNQECDPDAPMMENMQCHDRCQGGICSDCNGCHAGC